MQFDSSFSCSLPVPPSVDGDSLQFASDLGIPGARHGPVSLLDTCFRQMLRPFSSPFTFADMSRPVALLMPSHASTMIASSPGIAASSPAHHNLFRARDEDGRIAGASRTLFHWDRMPVTRRTDSITSRTETHAHCQDCRSSGRLVSSASSASICASARSRDMDVVADAGAVGRRVVVPLMRILLLRPERYIEDQRNQVRFRFVRLSSVAFGIAPATLK